MNISEIKEKYALDGIYPEHDGIKFQKGQKVYVAIGPLDNRGRAYPTRKQAEDYIKRIDRPGYIIKEDVFEGTPKKMSFARRWK